MNNLEKASAVIAVVIFIFTLGVGWNSLNNRIDKVDDKIGGIEKTLGSTACNAILTRQIESIEKGRAEARQSLEALSAQYNCLPSTAPSAYADALATDSEDATLVMQLNEVDAILNDGN